MTDDRQKYRHFFRCKACATRFHVDRLTADPAKLKTPACPKKRCAGKVKPSYQPDVGMDVGAGKAPGVVGANIQNTAYDRAMEITMADHQLGDIQDTSRPGAVYRPGEATAPKLPMHLQKQADGFWGSQQQKPAPRTAKVNLSGIFGQPQTTPAPAATFKTETGSVLDPILKHRPPGSSAVPEHTVIHG